MSQEQTDLLNAALLYGARGWAVIPLHSVCENVCSCGNSECPHPGKHPRIKNWPESASTDADQIKKWWKKWPDANIGILTGERSGIVVLDIDGSDGLAIIEKLSLPETIRVKSGSRDGWHFYFKAPIIPISTRIKALPEIDLISTGGYIIAPPSLHVSGNRYTSENMANLEPAPMPASLIELFQFRDSTPNNDAGMEGAQVIPSSQRNVTLTSWAGKMRRIGLTESEIFVALMERNRVCDPPLEQKEIETIARSIAKKKAAENNDKLEVQCLEELLSQEIEPINWTVEPILTEGLGILVGPPKIGKSQIALNLAISVATGEPFLGKFATKKGRVLLLFLEDGYRRVHTRTEMVLSAIFEPGLLRPDRIRPKLDLIEWGSKINKSTEGGIEMLDEWLSNNKDARLVVIDTLTRFRAMQRFFGNAYDHDVIFMEPLQALAIKHRVCILLIHHDRKGKGDDSLDKISGSKGLPGTADQCWLLHRDHRGTNLATLECFGRDFEEIEIGISVNKKMLWRYEGTATEVRLTQEQHQVLDILKEARVPVKSSIIAQEMGLKFSKVSKLLKKMLGEGLILCPEYGKYEIPR